MTEIDWESCICPQPMFQQEPVGRGVWDDDDWQVKVTGTFRWRRDCPVHSDDALREAIVTDLRARQDGALKAAMDNIRKTVENLDR